MVNPEPFGSGITLSFEPPLLTSKAHTSNPHTPHPYRQTDNQKYVSVMPASILLGLAHPSNPSTSNPDLTRPLIHLHSSVFRLHIHSPNSNSNFHFFGTMLELLRLLIKANAAFCFELNRDRGGGSGKSGTSFFFHCVRGFSPEIRSECKDVVIILIYYSLSHRIE